jgi:endonuclease III
MGSRLALSVVLRTLRTFYGPPPKPISTDPFHLILWEQVAYLVPDSRRREAYDALRKQVGLTPRAILAAPTSTLVAITRLGGSIAAPVRAARMRRSAELALDLGAGGLRRALRGSVPEARRVLKRFPMIGEPGADKILALSRSARFLPLDSNGLRVVERLGLSTGAKSYDAAYRRARASLEPQLPRTYPALADGGSLLRNHGQEVCRRGTPRCGACPLRSDCPTGLRH